jgi:hypothetical protein
MDAASSSTDVRDVEHSECKGMLLVAPWSVRCEEWIKNMAGLPDLLKLASESGELKSDESGHSRLPYVVRVFIYSTLPAENIIARFKTNTSDQPDPCVLVVEQRLSSAR